jgi:hypothetical protein
MKKNIFPIVAILFLAVFMNSCDKTQVASNCLMDAGEWKVTLMTVDGTSEDELPVLEIMDCEIYEDICEGEWKNDEGGHAKFAWQFREKGKVFEISRQEGDHTHDSDHAEEEAIAQCYAFSGVYEVKERKKDLMEFESKVTVGFSGQTAIVRIER